MNVYNEIERIVKDTGGDTWKIQQLSELVNTFINQQWIETAIELPPLNEEVIIEFENETRFFAKLVFKDTYDGSLHDPSPKRWKRI